MISVADSRTMVRVMFLSSLLRSSLLPLLSRAGGVTIDELAAAIGASRPERLEAWLGVGCALGELRSKGGYYRLHGYRARSVTSDPLLAAHYRSFLDYQAGPYADFAPLVKGAPGTGRDDLDRFAEEIAEVSLAAMPFVAPLLRRLVRERRPRAVLDAGCGSAPYSEVVLAADPGVTVTAVDVSSSVIGRARAHLEAKGHGNRVRLHVADLMEWPEHAIPGFDLIMLHNNIYYFEPAQRPMLFARLREFLAPDGEVLVTTMTSAGSVAAAHLHLMLVAQDRMAGLPGTDALMGDLAQGGLRATSIGYPVPTEPYVIIRAHDSASHY